MKKYKCPCCKNKTLNEQPPGTYEICSICFWEDDYLQYNNEDYQEGANNVSLKNAKINYSKYGVSDLKYVDRK